MSKVSKHENGCWLWTASVTGKSKTAKGGYGRFSINRKVSWKYAHRISWELHKGPIPNGILVCHTCDVPRCVNPDHLFLGTTKDNMADMAAKGRSRNSPRYGEDHSMAKLTREQVNEIRLAQGKWHDRGNSLLRRLAEKYGVTAANICSIRKGKTWKSVSSGPLE